MKAIQANPKPLREIFSSTNYFIIPDFQRPYSWEEEQCEQLFDDIVRFCKRDDQEENYFLGSIVVYHEARHAWNIVDGQQRLTTLMILIKALFDKAGTYTILQDCLYKQNPRTGKRLEELRLETQVEAGAGRNDAKDLQATINPGQSNDSDKKSRFQINYEYLKDRVDKLPIIVESEGFKQFIDKFLDNVVLLPIECESLDDALDLFQIINDRGLQLSDADIFKAKIYGAIGSPQDKTSFITRWGYLDKHDFLFRVFMHISRAEHDDNSRETKIRKYMLKKYLNDKNSLAKDWGKIMRCLELCHWAVEERSLCSKEIDKADEQTYWQILDAHPNEYWKYPLLVFLHKYVQGESGTGFHLPKDKQSDYLTLLRDTVRYFYIRGVVYNTITQVKDTTYKVYIAIHKGNEYAKCYQDNVDSNKDIGILEQRLENCEYKRYRNGLVFLGSIPSGEKDRISYSEALQGKIHIEHILPRKWWNNYDEWDAESHARDLDKLGNLSPLEWNINIVAGNAFFQRKQEKYAKSKICDAVKLSKKDSSTWYPKDVAERHEEKIKRLKKFFSEPFGSRC